MSQVFCQTLLKPLPGFSFEGAATQAFLEEQQMMATLKALKVLQVGGGGGVGEGEQQEWDWGCPLPVGIASRVTFKSARCIVACLGALLPACLIKTFIFIFTFCLINSHKNQLN